MGVESAGTGPLWELGEGNSQLPAGMAAEGVGNPRTLLEGPGRLGTHIPGHLGRAPVIGLRAAGPNMEVAARQLLSDPPCSLGCRDTLNSRRIILSGIPPRSRSINQEMKTTRKLTG